MKMLKTMVMLAMAAIAGTMPNVAQQGPDGTVLIGNSSTHAAWVTIYRGSGRNDKVGYACAPGNGRGVYINTKKPAQNSWTGYYVLVEVKASTTGDCSNHSNIQVIEANNPWSGNTLVLKPGGSGSVVLTKQ